MKICVFGAASAHISEKYVKAVEELGEMMAKRGHSLVFGCGGTGLMGAAARGVKRGGGYVMGVVPKFFKDENIEALFEDCDETVYTASMAERKTLMEDSCDAFIIVPGGVGTFEELFEVVTLKQLNRHNKAIAFYDIDGYYDILEEFMQHVLKEKFVTERCVQLYKILENPTDVLDYLEGYVPEAQSIQKNKLGD